MPGSNAAFLRSNFPVFLPKHPALCFDDSSFDEYLKQQLDQDALAAAAAAATATAAVGADGAKEAKSAGSEQKAKPNVKEASASSAISGGMFSALQGMTIDPEDADGSTDEDRDDSATHSPSAIKPKSPFVTSLHEYAAEEARRAAQPEDLTNKMLTENGDLAIASTKSPLVDLFAELEDVVTGARLNQLLTSAWQEDPLATLKIIFNARSIHLGKASRRSMYRSLGWLYQHHPLTLVTNLRWLTRPVIEKPKKKRDDQNEEDEPVFIEAERSDDDPLRFDARHGLAHGYWKDLLNLLALAVNSKLNVSEDPRTVLNIHTNVTAWNKELTKQERATPSVSPRERHKKAQEKLLSDPRYCTLHFSVARLFAEQLERDLLLYKKGTSEALRQISLCAKWAPTQKMFHDRHTFIITSIAEILYPTTNFNPAHKRQEYLRFARESYRRDIAALRKQLEIVERDITDETISNIKYERVPSLAMSRYSYLFEEKDKDRFAKYLESVLDGKARISGAVLFPSQLIRQMRLIGSSGGKRSHSIMTKSPAHVQVVNAQWKTLVERVKNSGTLANSMAVCDVSGSMQSPILEDGTVPLDSAVGLSLLVAEVTAPPFGGTFITFSEQPQVASVNLNASLLEKYRSMKSASWGMSTNFVAVFENLILPMAIRKKVKPADMVKQLFVFSDMQFNQATRNSYRWTSSYERIQKAYKNAGYEVPQIIFWNLAGSAKDTNPQQLAKPVDSDTEGTSLITGYSQGMLKTFLDQGNLDELSDEDEDEPEGGSEGGPRKKKAKPNPLDTLMKTISHPAYAMLRVVD